MSAKALPNITSTGAIGFELTCPSCGNADRATISRNRRRNLWTVRCLKCDFVQSDLPNFDDWNKQPDVPIAEVKVKPAAKAAPPNCDPEIDHPLTFSPTQSEPRVQVTPSACQCTWCGAVLPPNAKFCKECARPVVRRREPSAEAVSVTPTLMPIPESTSTDNLLPVWLSSATGPQPSTSAVSPPSPLTNHPSAPAPFPAPPPGPPTAAAGVSPPAAQECTQQHQESVRAVASPRPPLVPRPVVATTTTSSPTIVKRPRGGDQPDVQDDEPPAKRTATGSPKKERWEMRWDPVVRKRFFIDHLTKKTSWNPPPGWTDPPALATAPAAVPTSVAVPPVTLPPAQPAPAAPPVKTNTRNLKTRPAPTNKLPQPSPAAMSATPSPPVPVVTPPSAPPAPLPAEDKSLSFLASKGNKLTIMEILEVFHVDRVNIQSPNHILDRWWVVAPSTVVVELVDALRDVGVIKLAVTVSAPRHQQAAVPEPSTHTPPQAQVTPAPPAVHHPIATGDIEPQMEPHTMDIDTTPLPVVEFEVKPPSHPEEAVSQLEVAADARQEATFTTLASDTDEIRTILQTVPDVKELHCANYTFQTHWTVELPASSFVLLEHALGGIKLQTKRVVEPAAAAAQIATSAPVARRRRRRTIVEQHSYADEWGDSE
eukprot:NODE_729_length_2142_cov_83.527489_g695_i0.p1 GENE.NODE_729_length_2142_cov_83.527489_g695_i0~~NODE_729_length_2142_cov_83.527489_g695_i0.p1  ORF type:complete len:654 (-),score=128.84 NODE_729_length_2142_cov_83.527489_g695_i0:62-2023(-)